MEFAEIMSSICLGNEQFVQMPWVSLCCALSFKLWLWPSCIWFQYSHHKASLQNRTTELSESVIIWIWSTLMCEFCLLLPKIGLYNPFHPQGFELFSFPQHNYPIPLLMLSCFSTHIPYSSSMHRRGKQDNVKNREKLVVAWHATRGLWEFVLLLIFVYPCLFRNFKETCSCNCQIWLTVICDCSVSELDDISFLNFWQSIFFPLCSFFYF